MAEGPDRAVGVGAGNVADILRNVLEAELPPNFQAIYWSNARHLGPNNYDDFASAILLECLIARDQEEVLDAKAVIRIIDRVRHRMVRRARASASLPLTFDVPDRKDSRATEQRTAAEFSESIQRAVTRLSPLQTLIFERIFLDQESKGNVAAELGISRATLYRRIQEIRKVFAKYFRNG